MSQPNHTEDTMSQKDNIVKQTAAALGITQKELAERIGISKPTVERWSASGDIPENSVKHLELLLEHEKTLSELTEIKSSIKTLSKYS